ncbi:A24 family peptidase [Qipengyuania qiaonensis]|uniref:Prepilin peptidase n=1 Tax=Qipengyuania qiaonensis TaxID=2867240 RepID=A0ABS7JB11_9SPHN|nr:prepilin peptidase [Qipengyuania qiaonensis]MBX7483244.1 prepilin peptidase [Qipengyuania qiaonensis]
MQSEIFTYVLLAGLAIALLWVIVTDLKSRTISNRLTLTVALGAPLYWLSVGLPLWPGIAVQIGLSLIVFAVCCVLFAIRQMGGGDVKLLTALALWVPPSQFTLLLVAMAMLGWVLTMAVGAWRVARSTTIRTNPARDAVLLVMGTAVAALFASSVLGGPRLSLPAGLIDSASKSPIATIALVLAPFVILLLVTLGSIRIIRRHDRELWVPYGPAISLAGIWIVASGQMLQAGNAIGLG